MPKSDFIKRRDAEFAAQTTQFKTHIGDYAATLGLSAGQITAQAADADYFTFVLNSQDICAQCAQQWSAWKDFTRDGGAAGTPPPETPTMPAPVAAVLPGVEKRFRALARIIKAHPAYNIAMGEALGIEGPVQTGPDFSVFKPQLTLELSGGQVLARWGWQGQSAFLDMIEIHVDRGGGYQVLTYDSTPDYLDTAPLPATPAVWKYKAIFRVGDQRVGQWSDEASITVAA
ncbi:MAG TPA: hypothetical protein DIT64_14620 [Verrucomicrobiales bacterium]|nr:hypothetical protein [Verrucomicrobiales bacterium]